MAKHIAVTRPRLRTELIQRVTTDLANQGLVDWQERRVLGVFRRSRMVPTEAGERALEEYRRHEAALAALPSSSKGEADEVLARAAGLALLALGTASGVDSSAAASTAPSTPPPAFDSAFDAGFSDGGGGGTGAAGTAAATRPAAGFPVAYVSRSARRSRAKRTRLRLSESRKARLMNSRSVSGVKKLPCLSS